jgi:putative hydrolase of the HAD superfamily
MDKRGFGTSGSGAPRGVLLDFGGVMTASVGRSFARWCRREGLDHHVLMDALLRALNDETSPISAVERGELSPAEYERELAALFTAAYGSPIASDGLLRGLFAEAHLDPEMCALVDEARTAGHRTALVSNSWGDLRYAEEVRASFDAVVLSGELGIRKPDPRIFEEAAARIDVAPELCIFVDDHEPNLAGARSLGMTAIWHRDPKATREAIRTFLADGPRASVGG